MARHRQYYVSILVIGMLISGCANSLLTKYQDNQCVKHCFDSDKKPEMFEQPVFQTLQMFVAECCCWGYWLYNNRQQKHTRLSVLDSDNSESDNEHITTKARLLLSIPSVCDICGTTLMNVGLLLTPVSIYQMTRGGVVLFVGLFSMLFLKRVITRMQWIGLFSVFCGVFVVGLSSQVMRGSTSQFTDEAVTTQPDKVILGMMLIFLAQILTASQFVFEEFLLEEYPLDPIEMVSLEGTFGTVIIIVGSLFIYYIVHPNALFDLFEALNQVLSSSALYISSAFTMLSIATFNICGLSVTQEISATTRSTVDTSRTLGIWFVSLLIGWEKFNILQLAGFALLVYGTLLFNGLIKHGDDTLQNLLPQEVEHT